MKERRKMIQEKTKGLNLVVMIPAYNEEATIGQVIKEIPRRIEYIERVDVVVIDDGSTDNTSKEAKKAGADYILRHKKNIGLAVAFRDGLDTALKLGAGIIVNTDADFQYNQQEIPKLIKPILEGKADVVLTDRQVLNLDHIPSGKKYGNILATFVTKFVSGFPVKDAQSGFRAFSREAAFKLNLLADYTYVQETIIQAVDKNLKIIQIPCEFRKRAGDGKSRLISSLFNYAKRAGSMIIRSYVWYHPLKVMLIFGSIISLIGAGFGAKVLLHYFKTGSVSPYIPSAILTAIFFIIGFQVIILGLIADSIGAQRKLSEDILYRLKRHEYDKIKI